MLICDFGRPTMLVVQWKICVKSTFIDIEEQRNFVGHVKHSMKPSEKAQFPRDVKRCFPRDFLGPSSLGSKGVIWGKRYGR